MLLCIIFVLQVAYNVLLNRLASVFKLCNGMHMRSAVMPGPSCFVWIWFKTFIAIIASYKLLKIVL